MVVPVLGAGLDIHEFEGGTTTVTVDFTEAGTKEGSVRIPWVHLAEPFVATMNVTPAPHTPDGNDLPIAPSINIGGLGEPEWAFNGTGYGDYGRQTMFSDGNDNLTLDFDGAGKKEAGILIPKGAKIEDASIHVTGEKSDIRYSYDYLSTYSITETAYSERYNTLFLYSYNLGLAIVEMDSDDIKIIDSRSYPKRPFTSISHLYFEDALGLLFIGSNSGVHMLNLSMMEFVDTINTTTEMHTVSSYVSKLAYDHSTGILALLNGYYCTLIDYRERKNLQHYILSTSGMDISYSVRIDPVDGMIWISASNGIHGLSLETLEPEKRYDYNTDPPLTYNQVLDLEYDPADDLLMFTSSNGGWNGVVQVIDVAAGTIETVLSATSTPALPSDRPLSRIQYDPENGELYIATEKGIMVFDMDTRTEVTQYNASSSPALLHDYVEDMFFDRGTGLLSVGTRSGISVIDTVNEVTALDIQDFTDHPIFEEGVFRGHHTDVSNDRVIMWQTTMISVLDLNENAIVKTLTPDDYMGGHACTNINDVLYDEGTGLLFVAGADNNKPRIGIYELDTDTLIAYYDTTTTPSIHGTTRAIGDMSYDAGTDQLFFAQWYSGLTILNLTSDTMTYITDSTSPLKVPDLNVDSVAYDAANDLFFTGISYFGVCIFNLSSNTRTDLTDQTTPALGSTVVNGVYFDPTRSRLFVTHTEGLDVIDTSTWAIEARYSQTTEPAIPMVSIYELVLDDQNDIAYLSGYHGASVLDLGENKTLRSYTSTSNPPLAYDPVYYFDHYPTKDWDIISAYTCLQVIKPESSPFDVTLRVQHEELWEVRGLYVDSTDVTLPQDDIQRLLDQAEPMGPDQYGNLMVDLTLSVVSQMAGHITVDDLVIRYTHTSTTPDLSQAIIEYLETAGDDIDGPIPVTVSSSGPGKLVIDGLSLRIDEAPFIGPFPDITMYENTVRANALDIHQFLSDDFDEVADLAIGLEVLTNSSHVDIGLVDESILFVDAMTKPGSKDWTGRVDVLVTATDGRGLSNSSTLTIRVEPLHDIVILSEPVLEVDEDETYVYDVDAESRRGLSLTYSLHAAPAGMDINDTGGEITWTTTNDDVGSHPVTVNVTDGLRTVQQSFAVDVLPVNDAPVIHDLDGLVAYEGVPLVIDMRDHITDIDDDVDDLLIVVQSSYAEVTGTDVTFMYPKGSDITGENVTFMVSDDQTFVTSKVGVRVLGIFTVDVPPDHDAVEGATMKVDMATYIHDPQGKALTVTTTSKFITVNGTILEARYPIGCGMTVEKVDVTVSDGSPGNDTRVSFKVRITAVFPEVKISEPTSGSKVSGKVKVSGTSSIVSGTVNRVEVKVDDGPWELADGTGSWSYEFKTKDLRNGIHHIYVRAFSGNVSSDEALLDIEVSNPEEPTVSTVGWTATGLAIGLIIAAIIGVVAYMLGKGRSRDRTEPAPDENGDTDDNGDIEEDDEDGSGDTDDNGVDYDDHEDDPEKKEVN